MNKPPVLLFATVVFVGLSPLRAVPPPPESKTASELLRQGLFEEEANRDPAKAAAAYAGVVEQYDAQRKLAATALFRLAEIRVKQGNKADGTALYQRLLKEFPADEPLAKLSRERLTALGAAPPADADMAKLTARRESDRAKEAEEVNARIRREMEAERFRQAEGYVLRGEAEKAKNIYLDMVTNYPEDDSLVKLSYQRLAAMSAAPAKDDAKAAPDAPTGEEAAELARVRELVKNSPDLLNAAGGADGLAPLTRAALKGWAQVTAFLLDHGAKANGISNSGEPLHEAAANGHKTVVELLLAHGADINAATPDGWTALHAACYNRRTEVIRLLLDKGAKPNVVFQSGSNHNLGWGPEMQLSAWSANMPRAALLWDNPVIGTPLFIALKNEDDELLARLLDSGADPNLPAQARGDYPDKISPLIFALHDHQEAAAKTLLEHGAKADFVGGGGVTALHAAAAGAPVSVSSLLDRGLKQTPDTRGWTPLFYSVKYFTVWTPREESAGKEASGDRLAAYRAAWEALLAHGADINARDEEGETILHRSQPTTYTRKGFDWLLAHGADINARDKNHQTPLHLFCAHNSNSILNKESKEMIAWLIAHGADADAKDSNGNTPFDVIPSPGARIQLMREFRYPQIIPKLTREQAVTALIGWNNSPVVSPLRFTPAAEFDAPPSLAGLILKLSFFQPEHQLTIHVHRATAASPDTEVGRLVLRPGAQPADAAKWPALRWGDVVVFESDDGIVQTDAKWLRSAITLPKRTVSLQCGDRAAALTLADESASNPDETTRLRGRRARPTDLAPQPAEMERWMPTIDPLPDWTVSEMVLHLTEAEPRAQIDAVRLERAIDGKTQAWTLDLRAANPAETEPGSDGQPSKIKKLSARLADGDRIIIPLRSVTDAEALAARRGVICFAAPGRLFAEPVFTRLRNEMGAHTLGELLMQSDHGPMLVPNPDLSRIVIHRLKEGDSGEEESIPVDLALAISAFKARAPVEETRRANPPLQWGDTVEIALIDGAAPAQWKGFGAGAQAFLDQALSRKVPTKLNGKSLLTAPRPGEGPGEILLRPWFNRYEYVPQIGSPWFKASAPPGWEDAFSAMALLRGLHLNPESIVRFTIHQGEQTREYDAAKLKAIDPWLTLESEVDIQQFSP